MADFLKDVSGNFYLMPGGGFVRINENENEVLVISHLTAVLSREVDGNTRATLTGVPDNVVSYIIEFRGADGTRHIFPLKDPVDGNQIIGTTAEVFGPFAAEDDGFEINLAVLDLNGHYNPVLHIIASPAGPSVPAVTYATGASSGEITATLVEVPFAGDGAVVGDGAATITAVDVEIEDVSGTTSISPIADGTIEVISGLTPGALVRARSRASSAFRDSLWSGWSNVTVKGTVVVPVPPSLKAPVVPVSIPAGTSWSVNWSDYWNNATSYSVISGLTGGVESGTGNVTYTVANPLEGSYSLQVQATNADGSSSAIWDVTVTAVVVPVSLVSPIPDISIPIGTAQYGWTYDLKPHFTGTNPITIAIPTDSIFEITAAGIMRNKVAITTAAASRNIVVTASNAAGVNTVTDTVAAVLTFVRPDAFVVGTDVDVDRAKEIYTSPESARAPIIEFPNGVLTGSTLLWSTTEPDANGDIPLASYEYLHIAGTKPTSVTGGPKVVIAGYTAGSRSVTINISGGVSPYDVDWGDASTDVTDSALTSHLHSYSTSGTYTITVTDSTSGTPLVATVFLDTANINMLEWQTYMKDSSKYGVLAAPRQDYAVWFAAESARSAKLRVAYIHPTTGVISQWSTTMTVPNLEIPVSTDIPLPMVFRTEGTRDAPYTVGGVAVTGYAGSPGMQFQRVIERDQGFSTNWASNIYTVQDENNGWFSSDDGKTWGKLPMLGMWGTKCAGLRADSDENQVVVVVTGFGKNKDNIGDTNPRDGGIFVSSDGGKTVAFQCQPLDGTRKAFLRIANGQRQRVRQNCITRRPRKSPTEMAVGGTVQLTVAQRPWYVVENRIGDAGTTNEHAVQSVIIWKSTDNLATLTKEATLTPLANFASGNFGIYRISCCPNGDVVLHGRMGLWIAKGGDFTGANFVKLLSGEISEHIIFGGTSSTASGCYASGYGTNAERGLWKTSNVNTTAFVKATMTALPANPLISSFDLWPGSTTKLICSVSGSGNAYRHPYISTNSGASWAQQTAGTTAGESEAFRSGFQANLSSGHTAFLVSRANPNNVCGWTSQTISFSGDGGANFTVNNAAFFDGSHSKGFSEAYNDWTKISFIQQDRALQYFNDGGGGVLGGGAGYVDRENAITNYGATAATDATIANLLLGANSVTSGSGVIRISATRYVCFLNDGGASIPVVYEFDTDGTSILSCTPYSSSTVGSSATNHIFANPKALGTSVFAGRWLVSNLNAAGTHQLTFTSPGGTREILGYRMDLSTTPSTMYTYWAEEEDASAVYVSTSNVGASQSSLFSLGSSTTASTSFRHDCMAVDPFTANRFIYALRSAPLVIRERKRNVADTAWEDVALFDLGAQIDSRLTALGVGSFTRPSNLTLGFIRADYNMPGLFYAVTGGQGDQNRIGGHPCVWRTLDYGVTWTDITGDAPYTAFDHGWVSRNTGNLILGSSKGTWVWPVPTAYPAITDRNKIYTKVKTFLDKSNVADPPIFSA